MLVLPQLLASALIATSPPPLEGFFARGERAFFAPEGAQTLSFGTATLDVKPTVSLLRRSAAAPVRLTARGADIAVWGCIDWACALRNEAIVRDGQSIEMDLPVWSQTVHLRARLVEPHGEVQLDRFDNTERQCCRGPDRPVNGVAVIGGSARTAVVSLEPGRDVAFEGVGDLFIRRPELLAAVDAVLVLDAAQAPSAEVRDAFMERGGTWIDFVEEPGADVRIVDWRPMGGGARATMRGDANPAEVARVWAASSPRVAVAPGGAYLPAQQVVLNAAAVALDRHPPIALVLVILFAAFLVAALSMVRARRGAWRSALGRSAIAFFVAGLFIAAAKPMFVPREVRARTVVWLGPEAGTEVGADAARPRSGTADVRLSAPGPVLGAATLGSRAAPVRVSFPAGAQSVEVAAAADSGAALTWLRSSANERRVRVIDGALSNGLGEPIAFWVRDEGSRVGGPLSPGQAAASGGEAPHANAWEPFTRFGVVPHEERLLREVLDLCRQDGGSGCAAALVRRADETLVIEVRGW